MDTYFACGNAWGQRKYKDEERNLLYKALFLLIEAPSAFVHSLIFQIQHCV